MIRVGWICLLLLITWQLPAQRYISNTGSIKFFSEAPLENITAVNHQASSVFDLGSGEIVFSVPIKEFEFKKSLMKKHFNENYMDSDEYPKATFKGKLKNYRPENGNYAATAVGDLTIHGQTRKVEIKGDLKVSTNAVVMEAVFPVALKDYDIKIPKILFSNIAEEVEVTLKFELKPHVSN